MLRNKLNINIWLVFLIVITCIFEMQVSYAECGKNINDGIQKIIDEVRVKYQIPGIEVSISCPGENSPRDFISGTTTVYGSTLIKPNNLFQIGSETKSFIATILLQLESEGALSIDDQISKWLPQIPPAWKHIKIRQLLNHTSGIFNITEADEFWEIEKKSNLKKQWDPDELINLVVNKASYFEPGRGYHYSNTNYILAGMIIQTITGKSVEDEMKIRLFEPLKLSNTYYLSRAYSEDILQRMAHGYSDRFSDKAEDVTDANMSMADASGAIISTSHDSAIWLRQLLTSYTVLPEKQQYELMDLVDEKNGKPLPPDSKKAG
jgi:D-alanyl-D-alanine carboxypeptidase